MTTSNPQKLERAKHDALRSPWRNRALPTAWCRHPSLQN